MKKAAHHSPGWFLIRELLDRPLPRVRGEGVGIGRAAPLLGALAPVPAVRRVLRFVLYSSAVRYLK